MGAYITEKQIEQVKFIDEQASIPHINLFLDRDQAGMSGAQRATNLLRANGFCVRVFDWKQCFDKPDGTKINIPDTIKDAADMSARQLMWLRGQGKL